MTDLASLTITIDDIRKAGYCVAGARTWWRNHPTLPVGFNAFISSGISAADLIEHGDDLARTVVERKLEREAAHG